jgi:MFS transporter, PAT family, beta-lactamase induction signal transducer AmpG
MLMFGFISTYRLTDYTMGTMANSFYLILGYTLKQMGVAKFYGAVS